MWATVLEAGAKCWGAVCQGIECPETQRKDANIHVDDIKATKYSDKLGA